LGLYAALKRRSSIILRTILQAVVSLSAA